MTLHTSTIKKHTHMTLHTSKILNLQDTLNMQQVVSTWKLFQNKVTVEGLKVLWLEVAPNYIKTIRVFHEVTTPRHWYPEFGPKPGEIQPNKTCTKVPSLVIHSSTQVAWNSNQCKNVKKLKLVWNSVTLAQIFFTKILWMKVVALDWFFCVQVAKSHHIKIVPCQFKGLKNRV
jgi:hypothetical protein